MIIFAFPIECLCIGGVDSKIIFLSMIKQLKMLVDELLILKIDFTYNKIGEIKTETRKTCLNPYHILS